MKAATLKLLIPIIAMTAQQTAAGLIIPPFLESLHYPLSAIGALISVVPCLALVARLPSGLIYRGERARALMLVSLAVMTVFTFLYGFAVEPLQFTLVQAAVGFSYGAATTIYLAYFVDALPPDEDRRHAMGYYTGCLAVGYSVGGFAAGYAADKLGYVVTFQLTSLLGLLCIVQLFFMRPPPRDAAKTEPRSRAGAGSLLPSLRHLVDPRIATMVVVAMFLNLLHQMANSMFPLYGLAVGLSLTEVGSIRALFSLCNAVTRPLSGTVVSRLGYAKLSRAGLPLQSLFMMLVPFFYGFTPLLMLFLLAGFVRAVLIVANTISMVEDADAARVGRGVISGVYNAAGDVGSILGPSAGGLIASFTGIAHLFFVGPLAASILFFVALWSCRFFNPTESAGP